MDAAIDRDLLTDPELDLGRVGREVARWQRKAREATSERGRKNCLEKAERLELGASIAADFAVLDAARQRIAGKVRRFVEIGGWHGFKSPVHWLSWRCGLTPYDAREVCRVAEALGELPEMDEALGEGEISWSKVRKMTRVAEPGNEEDLVRWAKSSTGGQMQKICRMYRTQSQAFEASESDEPPPVDRWFRKRGVDERHVRITAQLLTEEGAVLEKAMEHFTREALRERGKAKREAERAEARGDATGEGIPETGDGPGDGAAGPEADEETTGPTRRPPVLRRGISKADSLVGIAERALQAGASSSGMPGRTEVILTTSASELVEGVGEGALESGERVPMHVVRQITCDAGILQATLDEDGSPLDVGRKTRSIPTPTRRALRIRDGGCTFPACDNELFCDGHHVVHWADGGTTSLDNLALVCRAHHRMLHREEIGMEMVDGRPRFFFPDGKPIPEVPGRPPLNGVDLKLMRRRLEREGVRIGADTNLPRGYEPRPDYGSCVETLWKKRGPPG